MRVRVRGHDWDLIFEERLASGAWGEMDTVGTPRKEIRIALQQSSLDVIDTLLHELLHAAYPDLDEDAVADGATDIAKVFYRLGVRVEDTDKAKESDE